MPAVIHLYRHMRTAWRDVVAPWLRPDGGARGLGRSYIVVPTRGQAHAFKQRCLIANIPLLGAELLTPGLARSRWMSHMEPGKFQPALGREFLLFGLREIVGRHLAPLDPADEKQKNKWGLLKSLQSDCERALGDFDDLLKGGFSAKDFPEPALQTVFAELTAWVENLGRDFAPRQTETFVRSGAPAAHIPGRLLIHGFSAEQRGEFFNVAAFARCFDNATVTLPEPEFRGRKALDESWIELWETTLGANAVPLDEPATPRSCENVAEIWASTDGIGAGAAHALEEQTSVIVGATRADEMEFTADKIAALLSRGAENIGVIFPASDAAHLRLAELLEKRGIPFADQLETAAPPPVEIQAQRALLAFYKNGCRLEDVLALWPLLQAMGETGGQPLSTARDVCERLFDKHQTHSLARCAQSLADGAEHRAEWADVASVCIGKLLGRDNAFVWPEQLAPADALARFSAACERFNLGGIPGRDALRDFAEKETRALPAPVVFALLESFLPAQAPAAETPGRGCFARVTLTTRRRAEGGLWSHLIFAEANAGVWPERQEASGWLPDETRAELNRAGHGGIDLFTADDRAFLEKRSYAALARDTSEAVVFTAALFDEEEPELKLAPNSWLERVRWQILAARSDAAPGHGELFDQLARRAGVGSDTDILPVSEKTGEPHGQDAHATQSAQTHGQDAHATSEHWHSVWLSRRDPAYPFDEYFFCAAPRKPADIKLGVRQIEDGVADPMTLWFNSVLGTGEVGWRPFERSPNKIRGQLAHWLLSHALRGDPAGGRFQRMPDAAAARARLDDALAQLRKTWPDDSYWASFHMELAGVCDALLNKTCAHDSGEFVATEYSLPKDMRVQLDPGDAGSCIRVSGRMDLLRLDRLDFHGATVDIIDFKTGKAGKLSADAMGAKGELLQLGIYLEAARRLGATGGRVWLLKPGAEEPTSVGMEELPQALACLRQINRHLVGGRYGALTADPSEYAFGGGGWPLACARIPHAVLKEKFKATFGGDA
ncbi:MAG: PD-(D/E)XK nuclease family protein [Opitutaceae bacterium]|jgi:RecB family exonuclease|nr:PD-(D/E)XK nuclease family protein [Opitutaceae bacterium]